MDKTTPSLEIVQKGDYWRVVTFGRNGLMNEIASCLRKEDAVLIVQAFAAQAALKALVEAAEIVLANATVIPDPAMKGSTDTYSVPLDDIEALKKALALAQEVGK